MKKIAYIAGFAGMAPVIMGAVLPGAANATTTAAQPRGTDTHAKTVSIHPVTAAAADYTCHGPAHQAGRYCSTSVYNRPDGTQFFFRSGGSTIIPDGTKLRVSCWYSGDTGFPKDPYWDHVTMLSGLSVVGHVRDKWVNFGGDFPSSSKPTPNGPAPELPECG